jgi:hypothetical protein
VGFLLVVLPEQRNHAESREQLYGIIAPAVAVAVAVSTRPSATNPQVLINPLHNQSQFLIVPESRIGLHVANQPSAAQIHILGK